ncbi:MAG: type II toxin-antitoxin system VapC family toxin [Gammaproteobacteria bacterium]
MSIYLDTSVLVSVYVPEKHSQNILNLLTNSKERFCVSRLVETEFFSALACKKRTKELSQSDINSITVLFHQHMSQLIYEKVYITDAVYETAIHFLTLYKTQLRTLDALHLACASNIDAKLITADKVLAKSAEQLQVQAQLI